MVVSPVASCCAWFVVPSLSYSSVAVVALLSRTVAALLVQPLLALVNKFRVVVAVVGGGADASACWGRSSCGLGA